MQKRSVTETRKMMSAILEQIGPYKDWTKIGELNTDLNRASANCPSRQDPDIVTDVDETAMLPIAQSDEFIDRAQRILEDWQAREDQLTFLHGQKVIGS